MNSNDPCGKDSGAEAASAQDSRATTPESKFQDGMKRAAAKQLIEAYYFQLTDGCGNGNCQNESCASSSQFSLTNTDRNALALLSIELFKKKAQLCDNQRQKIARLPEGNSNKTPKSPPSVLETTPVANIETKDDTLFTRPSTSRSPGATPKSSTTIDKTETINFLTEEKLVEILSYCRETKDWSSLIKTIGSVYNNPDSLMRSFKLKCANRLLKEQIQSMDIDSDKDVDEKEDSESGEKIRFPTRIQDLSGDICVDLKSLRRCYGLLEDIPDQTFQGALINALLSLARTIDMDLRFTRRLEQESGYLNIFVIVMEIPFLHSPEFIDSAFPEFCKAVGRLPLSGQVKLARYWSQFNGEKLNEMVLSIQQLITVKLIDGESRWGRNYSLNDEEYITGPIRVMKILYYASMFGGQKDQRSLLEEEKQILESDSQLQHELLGASAMGLDFKEPRQVKEDPLGKELEISHVDCRKPLVPYEDFVNETLNEHINVEIDYKYKLESDENPGKFSFANFSFILTTASKQMSLYMDNRIQMYKERRSSILQTIMHGMPPMPFLRIRVSRDRLIDDALVALEMVAMENPSDLRKQLFVEFDGEQGLDEGGVSKEFFQLVVEEIFNIDFGMFTYNTVTNQYWFNPTSFENDGQFTLIGVVLGLAIYNSTIVDVHFPPVVYRKLVGKKGTFEDLADVDPTLASSLQEMLDNQEDDFEDIFMQSFQISYKDVFGSIITHELKENGDTIPVTLKNKKEFVTLYCDFILNKSIEKQFRAFRRGFQMVTNESPLRTLFQPSEIELLVCGSQHLDFFALEQACEYDGGFEKHSQTIKHFWDIVHGFDEEQKRKLLQFTTGTDRVPVGGLSKLKLIIARNGPDSDRLPTAHTCFNVLLLPDYENKAKLEERLLKAITYSKGFGML